MIKTINAPNGFRTEVININETSRLIRVIKDEISAKVTCCNIQQGKDSENKKLNTYRNPIEYDINDAEQVNESDIKSVVFGYDDQLAYGKFGILESITKNNTKKYKLVNTKTNKSIYVKNCISLSQIDSFSISLPIKETY